jgi:nucleotide-binding universal stress UspA family protein
MESSDIVIGVDGSASSWDALYWAVREAHRRRSRLHVAFVDAGPWPDPVSAGRKLAHMVADARRLEPAVRVTGGLAAGDPVSALCAASSGAALLVVGDAADGPGGRTPLGRAGREVAMETSVPVVVVRGSMPGERSPIVVGADGSAGAEAAVGLAFEEARLRDCPLIVVFAYGQPTHPWAGGDARPRMTDGTAHAALDESLLPWRDKYPLVPVEATTTDIEPTPALVALSRNAQLVVVGAHGHGDADAPLGSVPQTVLDRAHCPVLISR